MIKWIFFLLVIIGIGQKAMAQKTEWPKLLNPRMEDSAPIFLKDYFASFSKIKSNLKIGKTDHFCSYEAIDYENGIRYSIMDNGPCEQCGNHVEIIFMPEIGVEQAFHFFIQFKQIEESEISFQLREVHEFKFFWEFGEVIILSENNGILIHNNLMY